MFCPKCRCEFVGWTGKCPDCKIPLVQELPSIPEGSCEPVSYAALVDLVKANGGQLRIELATTDVGMEKKRRFPFLGYGLAWAKRMQGASGDIVVDLTTVEVGVMQRWRFPYLGYGFAWVKRLQGSIAGHDATLTAKKVGREKKWGFPYFGFGYAWTCELAGQGGDALRIDLSITDLGRRKERGFPYFGFGLAWENQGLLVLTLAEKPWKEE